jgi:hypothetical protein
MLFTAFYRFLYRPAPPAVLAAAERSLDPSVDYEVRNSALRVVAISGQKARALEAYEAALANPQNLDYTAMSAIAEIVPPDQLPRLIERVPVSQMKRGHLLRHSGYAWADAAEKTRTTEDMLRSSWPEDRAAGLKHLLETGQANLLMQLQVRGFVSDMDGQSYKWYERPDYRSIVARLGYRLSPAGDNVVIEKVGTSRQ